LRDGIAWSPTDPIRQILGPAHIPLSLLVPPIADISHIPRTGSKTGTRAWTRTGTGSIRIAASGWGRGWSARRRPVHYRTRGRTAAEPRGREGSVRRVRRVIAAKRDIGARERGRWSAAPRRDGAVSIFTCGGGWLSGCQANVSDSGFEGGGSIREAMWSGKSGSVTYRGAIERSTRSRWRRAVTRVDSRQTRWVHIPLRLHAVGRNSWGVHGLPFRADLTIPLISALHRCFPLGSLPLKHGLLIVHRSRAGLRRLLFPLKTLLFFLDLPELLLCLTRLLTEPRALLCSPIGHNCT
jgi:hypothetical protein